MNEQEYDSKNYSWETFSRTGEELTKFMKIFWDTSIGQEWNK